MEPEQAEAVLAKLEAAPEVKSLAHYPDDSAGGLMTSAYLTLWRRMTAQQAIDTIRDWRPDEETIYYLFVIDRLKRLLGVINLRQLIVADPHPVAEIMTPMCLGHIARPRRVADLSNATICGIAVVMKISLWVHTLMFG